jgi:hypothetical protein
VICFSERDLLRASVFEGVRWWFMFDGLQASAIARNNDNITVDQVGVIASQYNFRRNIPSEPERVQYVVDTANAFAGKTFNSFDERATMMEASINDLHAQHMETSAKGKAFRIVSGMTKLTWFVAPQNWTPFDRLAAAAIGVKNADVVKRMRAYYRKLDEIGFADVASRIAEHAKGTPFEQVSGERILDKFLMFNGEDKWTRAALPMANGFPDALPPQWRQELYDFTDKVLNDAACRLELEANT